MTGRGVLVVARDAGAASALTPVVAALIEVGTLRPHVVAWGNARAAFEAEDLRVLEVPEDPEPDEIEALLASVDATIVLTGTSLRVERDARFWDGAEAAGIPSVALLDHWKNYAERFTIRQPFDALPTVIAVMDDVAERELISLGCPANRIRVTGQPRFDGLSAPTSGARARARHRLGVSPGRLVVAFASEPRGAPYDDGSGFTRDDALRDLLAGVDAVAPDALVVVKIHPVEQDEPVFSEGTPEVRVLRDWSIPELIAAADLFFGMTSIVLLDAALVGVPTVSVRPGGAASHFVDLHADLIATAATPTEIRAALEEGAGRKHIPVASPLLTDSTARVRALLAELVSADGIMPA